jgi:hypothetical protein
MDSSSVLQTNDSISFVIGPHAKSQNKLQEILCPLVLSVLSVMRCSSRLSRVSCVNPSAKDSPMSLPFDATLKDLVHHYLRDAGAGSHT